MQVQRFFLIIVFMFLVQVEQVISQNLLSNPGFEDGLTAWTKVSMSGVTGNAALTADAHVDAQACLMTTDPGTLIINKFGVKSSDYSVQGNNFTLKVQAKTDAVGVAAGLGFKFQLVAVESGGTIKYFASSELKLTDTYEEYSFTLDKTGTDYETARFVLQCGGYAGNYYFDDAVLEDGYVAPEPGVIVPVEVTPLIKITTSEKVVAFTFDDGPDAALTQQFVDLFAQYNGHATFFNIGNKLSENKEIVQQVLNKGHEIGNHSMTHARIPDYAVDDDIISEIRGFQELYQSEFNYTPKYFRAPFLDYGQNNDPIDHRVGGVLTTENLIPINAKVYAGDASSPAPSEIIAKLADISAGDIVLCHERANTLEALQTVLSTLSDAGYRFVTLSELFRIEAGYSMVAPTHENIIIEGSNYISNINNELNLHRHSDAVYANTTLINLFNPSKARTTSGIIVRFKTNSPTVKAKFRMIPSETQSCSWGVFQNDVFVEKISSPYAENQEKVLDIASMHSSEIVEYEITLPLWTNVSFSGLELENGYNLSAIEVSEKPIYLAYGNSITHGRGQTMTNETYPYIVSRKFDWTLYNTAVGGGKTSQVMAEMIRDDFDKIDVMTMLIGYNDAMGGELDTLTYSERYTNFLNTIREKHTNTKIFCLTLTYTRNVVTTKTGIPTEDFRKVVRHIVNERINAGDENLFLIEGDDISDETTLNPSPDDVHFSVDGASEFADQLFLKMDAVLKDNPLAVFDEAYNLSTNVFPNPTSHSITINEIDINSEVVVRDLSGKMIKSFSADIKNQPYSLSDLMSGVYFVSYYIDDRMVTEKIIKNN